MRQQLSLTGRQHHLALQSLWALPGFLSLFLLSAPAEAAKLASWNFNSTENRLVFTTDEAVRPKAQLIANPTRVVIDLPGTTLGRPKISQTIGSAVQAVRIAQFEQDTTRIVIELASGYTLDPQAIKVQGSSLTQWAVDLPTPKRLASNPTQSAPGPALRPSSPSPVAAVGGATQIRDVRVTPDGFFIDTQGKPPQVKISRSRNKKQVNLELRDTAVSASVNGKRFAIERYGVKTLAVNQVKSSTPSTRLTLDVDKNSPDWIASVSRFGGVVLLPRGKVSKRATDTVSLFSGNRSSISAATNSRLAVIESVALGGNQLLIRSNQALSYSTGWEDDNYRLTLRSARLAENFRAPRLGDSSALSQLRVRQINAQTVEILAAPARGVRIAGVTKPSASSVLLTLQRPGLTLAVSRPIAQDINPTLPQQPDPQPNLPTPKGRWVVVIDPGHGGEDPGAIGIGGLQEKEIVLDISRQVAALLNQQGVNAILTRSADLPSHAQLDLQPRVDIAERNRANIFVSIHANAINMSRPDISGLETYYAPGSSQGAALARSIHNSILNGVNIRDRGVRAARFYVIRKTSMPATLVETGFVTGAEDAARFSNSASRQQLATAIARGILQYLQSGR